MPGGVFLAEELKTALIDFYILSKGVPSQFTDSHEYQQYRLATINAWKRTLLRDIEFCCACELRHIADSTANPKGHTHWKDWFQTRFGDMGATWYSKWSTLRHNPPLPSCKDGTANADIAYLMHANMNNSKGRKYSYLAAKNLEFQHGLSLIEICVKVFDPALVTWSGSYGGKAWQRIAQTMFHLWHAIDLTEIVHLIDTAFALHHNTNIVFNKNSIWAGGSSYTWIQSWLDYKWAAYSPVSLMGLASPELRNLVTKAGFNMGTDFAPRILARKGNGVKPGQSVGLTEEGHKHVAKVNSVHGDYFKSVVLTGGHYKVQKTFGKYTKTLNLRIYSLEEFLNRLDGAYEMGVDKAVPGADKPVYGPGPIQQLMDDFLYFKSHLHSVYEALATHVMKKGLGYSLGNFLEAGTSARFRLKGHPNSLRFYFLTTSAGLEVHVGLTEFEDIGGAKLLTTVQKGGVAKLLGLLKMTMDTHLAM